MNEIMTYIVDNYKPGDPIFSSDLSDAFAEKSKETIRQALKKLTDHKKLCRHSAGVYFIPNTSRLNTKPFLSSENVAMSKYVERNGEHIGYYYGNTLANKMGFSMQMPVKKEIVSNKVTAIVKDVKVGNFIYRVRRPRVTITNENYKTLQLLEALSNANNYKEIDDASKREQFKRYIEKNKIEKVQFEKYLPYFPERTYKNMHEMRIDDVFTILAARKLPLDNGRCAEQSDEEEYYVK